MLVTTSVTDTVKRCLGKTSETAYAENMVYNAAGIGNGCVGSFAGTTIDPGIGTVIGDLIGGKGGGVGATSVCRKVNGLFRKKRK